MASRSSNGKDTTLEQAAVHYATGAVGWVEGEAPLRTLRGGHNAVTGRQSSIEVHPIVALRGAPRINLFDVVPSFGKLKLFRRDRFTCAYCGLRFTERELQCEHVVPQSRGGRWIWMNLVTACGHCNGRKADRTPEEAGMPLICSCRTCRAASRTFCSKAGTSAPTSRMAGRAPAEGIAPELRISPGAHESAVEGRRSQARGSG